MLLLVKKVKEQYQPSQYLIPLFFQQPLCNQHNTGLLLRAQQMREACAKQSSVLSEDSIDEEEGWKRKARERQIGSTQKVEEGDNTMADMELCEVMFIMNREEEQRDYLSVFEEEIDSLRNKRKVVHSTSQMNEGANAEVLSLSQQPLEYVQDLQPGLDENIVSSTSF